MQNILTAKKEVALKFLKTAKRAQLIKILSNNDSNGIYSDKDSIQEFGKPATLKELKESFLRLLDSE